MRWKWTKSVDGVAHCFEGRGLASYTKPCMFVTIITIPIITETFAHLPYLLWAHLWDMVNAHAYDVIVFVTHICVWACLLGPLRSDVPGRGQSNFLLPNHENVIYHVGELFCSAISTYWPIDAWISTNSLWPLSLKKGSRWCTSIFSPVPSQRRHVLWRHNS